MSTRSSTADLYIVVLDVAGGAVRALLFDSGACRMEGYGAQLPSRTGAALDCLDELHRQIHAAGRHVAAIVGRAESEVPAEDRRLWPAFDGALWFAGLDSIASAALGSGCLKPDRFSLVVGDLSSLAAVIESSEIVPGLTARRIDERRLVLFGTVPGADVAYTSLRRKLGTASSLEVEIEKGAAESLRDIALRFREIYEILSAKLGPPAEVVASGAGLLKSPAWTQMMADSLGANVIACTEPEPAGRGAALWALERIGAIARLDALPASTSAVFAPRAKQTTL